MIDQLESKWSPDVLGEMMATNNADMQKDEVSHTGVDLGGLGDCNSPPNDFEPAPPTYIPGLLYIGIVSCHCMVSSILSL